MTSTPTSPVAVPDHVMPTLTLSAAPPAGVPGQATGRLRTAAWLPSAALATVAVVWGATFTVVDGATETLPAPDLVLWRFGLASLLLSLVGRRTAPLPRLLRVRSTVLGTLLGSGFLLQAWALTHTDALMSGFLTGLLVVIAPMAACLMFRERLSSATWGGVALAGTGVAVLGFHTSGFGQGELLTLASATVWGLHLVLMSRWSQTEHAWRMARTQSGSVAALAGLVLLAKNADMGSSPLPDLPADARTWISVAFLAVVATAAAMVLLSWAQSRISAARAAVILTLEPAVSGLTAALAGSALTVRVLVGGLLLITAMAVVELARPAPPADRQAGHGSPPAGRPAA